MAITVGDAILRMSVDKGPFDRDIKSAEKLVKDRMGKMRDSLKATSASFLKIGRQAGIMAGIGAGAIGVMVKSAADFDKAMREVNTLVGLSEEQMASMRAEVKALSLEMGIDAVEASKALYQAISAGQEPAEALEFLNVAARTAIGGITSLETATTGLTSIMNAFGIEADEAEHVADVLFVSMKGGITTIKELSTSFFQVAPIAAALGVSFEEVAAAATTITKSGTPTKIAFTSLRQAIVALANPTEDMADLLRVLGFESGTAALDALGLQGTFQALATETGATQEQLVKAIGSIEAMQAVFGITGLQAEEFSRQMEDVQNATGASQAAFDEMAESASFQFARAQQSMQALRRELGEAMLPAVIEIMNALRKMLEPVTEWMQKNPELAKWIGIIAVGLVAFVAGIAAASLAIGVLTGGVAALIGMMTTLRVKMIATKLSIWAVTAAQWLWNIAMTANPIGLVIAAIALLVASLILLWKNIGKVTDALMFWKKSTEDIGDASDELVDRIRSGNIVISNAITDTVFNLTSKWKTYHELRARQEEERLEAEERIAGQIARNGIVISNAITDTVFNLSSKWKTFHEMRDRQIEEEERLAQELADFQMKISGLLADQMFNDIMRTTQAKIDAAELEKQLARDVADARIAEFRRANDIMGIIRDRQAEALKEPERERARGRLAEALTPEEAARSLLQLGRLRAQIFQTGSSELLRAGGLGELNLGAGATGLLGIDDPANMIEALRQLEGGSLTKSLRFDVKNLLAIFERLADQGKVLVGGQPIAMGRMTRSGVASAGAGGGFTTANITLELDGRVLARALGQPLVDEIRLRQAVRA